MPTLSTPMEIPINMNQDYQRWKLTTQETRTGPTVWICDPANSQGHYHYRQGHCEASYKINLDSQAFRLRKPCSVCFCDRPKPIILDPPAWKSPKFVKLGLSAIENQILTDKERLEYGERAEFMETTLQKLNESLRCSQIESNSNETK